MKLDSPLRHYLETLGLAPLVPEPEVARAELCSIRSKSLAHLIAGLINANEPLLSAEAKGATVTVRERGGDGAMRFTVESEL